MSTKNPSKQKRKQPYGQNQSSQQRQQGQQGQQTRQAQTQQAKPKPAAVDAQAVAAQEAARKEARLQRQAQARAEAEQRKRQANLRRYGIIAIVVVALVAIVGWLIIREAGKPGQGVDVMVDRTHLTNATDPHTPYSTDPPTSGPHTANIPNFQVYSTPIPKELQVHGLEDGGVVINYQPDLDQAAVDKLAQITDAYLASPEKNNVLMSPYPGLSNSIVLTSWGRIDRLDTLDEARIRRFIEAYANVDHHEGKEGLYIP